MKIINNGLPEPIYQWLLTDFYDTEQAKGSISITSLLKPIQEYLLVQRHIEEIEVDATDRIWSLFGSSVHAVLDKLEGDTEERLFADILGRKISGKYDRVENNTLHDYKVTSVWTLIFKSRLDEWAFQGSGYRYLYFKNKGVKLSDTANYIVICRDWAERDKEKKNYPKLPIVEVKIPLLSLEATEKMLTDKVLKIIEAEKLEDDKLPHCNPEERWYNPKKDEFMKCAKYCNARSFCHQWKFEKEQMEQEGEEQ